MRTIGRPGTLGVLAAFLLLLVSGPARAQANRTFVSGHGSDSNPCSLGAPCRSFAQALTQTNPGGEITVLDSAGYGPVTITQSVTITNPGGVEAGVTATSGQDAITINTPSAAAVTLRGLTIEGGNVGNNGIAVVSNLPNAPVTGALNVINCVVKDFTLNGIAIEPSAAAGGITPVMRVVIADSFFLNNAGAGIAVAAGMVQVFVSITRAVASNNATGVYLNSSTSLLNTSLDHSNIDNNTAAGISISGNDTFLVLKSSTAQLNSGYDLTTGPGATAFLYAANVVHVINNTAGIVYTDGTNDVSLLTGPSLTNQNLAR